MFPLPSHLACAHIRSDSGSSLVARASRSLDGFQREGFWGLAGHIMGWRPLPPLAPPQTEDLLCAHVRLGNPLDHKNEDIVVASPSTQSGPNAPAGTLSSLHMCQAGKSP